MILRKMVAALSALLMAAMAQQAHAQIMLDEDGEVMNAVTYAQETLATVETTRGGVKYYKVSNEENMVGGEPANYGGLLSVETTGMVDLTSPTDMIKVEVELDGMLFTADSDPQIKLVGGTTWVEPIIGGGKNDNFVVFSLPCNSDDDGECRENAEGLKFRFISEQYAIPADGKGSVTITQEYLGYEVETSFPDIIMVKQGLTEVSEPANVTASVAHDFEQFVDDQGNYTNEGKLGSIEVGFKENYYSAENGDEITKLKHIMSGAEVTVDGNFSFVTRATFRPNNCNATADDRVEIYTDDDMVERSDEEIMLEFVNDTHLEMRSNVIRTLCLHVPEGENAMPIPMTDNYMATITYKKIAGAAFAPESMGPYSLGRVTRDGVTVHIGFLSTQQSRKQRVYLTNHGSRDASYMFSFTPEDGVMATGGTMAQGTAPAGETTMLNVSDVVTLSGGSRTAAMLSIGAQHGYIEVTSTLVNPSVGTIVTTEHMVESQ